MARAQTVWVLALSVVLSALFLSPSDAPAAPVPPHGGPSVAPATLTTTAEQRGLTLTRVSPVVAAPGEPVTLTGLLDVDALGLDLSASTATTPSADGPTGPATATPPPQDPIATVEVRLGSRTPTSRDDIDDWVSGAEPTPGRVLATSEIVAAPDRTIDRIPFSVIIDDLHDGMRAAYGILPVSVEVRVPERAEPAAVLRTFVGYQVRKEYEPLGLTWVVPVTLPGDPTLLGAFGDERTAAWEALLGEGGSLRARLAAASDPRTVWALDPALLSAGPALEELTEDPDAAPDESATSTATPTTTDPAGDPSASSPAPPATSEPEETTEAPADESPAAAEHRLRTEFATLLLEAVDGRDVLLLPVHDADVAALPAPTAEGETPAAIRALIDRSLDVGGARALLTDAGATVEPAVWPAAGGWSTALDAALHDLSGRTEETWNVLASTSSIGTPVRGPFPAATGATVLPYDDALSARASAAGDRSDALTSALALMADSLVLLNERPGTTRQVIVALDREGAAADMSADLTSVLGEVPWLDLTGATEATHDGTLVDEAPPTSVPTLLADEQARRLAETLDRLPVAASVRADTGSDLATRGADTLAQLTSVRWRGQPEDWSTAYGPIGEDVTETFSGLTIPSRDISFLADSGLLRVAVENTLDTGIENATLDLTVAHPILRIESGPQPVEVSADSRSTVGFQATAIASGRVSVTATLRAADGTVLGEPTEFSVRVSPTSDWIYWVLGALAGIVIAIGVARMALRRRPSA